MPFFICMAERDDIPGTGSLLLNFPAVMAMCARSAHGVYSPVSGGEIDKLLSTFTICVKVPDRGGNEHDPL
jgi:hypothetical protein